MLEFLKSIFIPRRMSKHRYMSIIIAICLFICSAYILVLPAKSYYNKNTIDMVNEQNLASLQVIRDLPRGGDITDFVNDIKSKELVTEKSILSANNLGVNKINVSGNAIGYLQKNIEDNYWYFNGNKTNVVIADNSNNKPNIVAVDGGLILSNVNDKVIAVEGIVADELIDVIALTVDEKTSKLVINDKVYDRVITDDTLNVTVNGGKLIVNDEITDVIIENKCVIYFTPKKTLYYEKVYSYIGNDGVKRNLLFAINLNAAVTDTVPFTVEDEKYDYVNEEYFFIICNLSSVYYQAHLKGINEKNVEHGGNVLTSVAYNTQYGTSVINSEEFNVENFGTYFLNIFVNGYASMSISNFTLIALLYLMVFTLIVALLFSLLFKKNGRLKTFKEYYNIAALANLVPMLITFIFTWFNPAWFGTVYLTGFSIYYLFVLYRINNSSELV